MNKPGHSIIQFIHIHLVEMLLNWFSSKQALPNQMIPCVPPLFKHLQYPTMFVLRVISITVKKFSFWAKWSKQLKLDTTKSGSFSLGLLKNAYLLYEFIWTWSSETGWWKQLGSGSWRGFWSTCTGGSITICKSNSKFTSLNNSSILQLSSNGCKTPGAKSGISQEKSGIDWRSRYSTIASIPEGRCFTWPFAS